MSGVNDSFVGKNKQTAANVLYQFIEVASCEIGNKLTEAQQWAKLALVKEIAEEVWG